MAPQDFLTAGFWNKWKPFCPTWFGSIPILLVGLTRFPIINALHFSLGTEQPAPARPENQNIKSVRHSVMMSLRNTSDFIVRYFSWNSLSPESWNNLLGGLSAVSIRKIGGELRRCGDGRFQMQCSCCIRAPIAGGVKPEPTHARAGRCNAIVPAYVPCSDCSHTTLCCAVIV